MSAVTADTLHNTTGTDAAPSYRERTQHTITLARSCGPLVVDVWEPAIPADVAPILLIHGWGGTGSYWHETAFELSIGAKVIVPDLPGTGRSQPVCKTQRLADQVETLIDLLDELEVERVQVVGHSMGGAMALLLAAAQPQRVERVILTSLSFFLTRLQKRVYHGVMSVFKASMGLRRPWMVSVPGLTQAMAKRYFHNVPENPTLLRRGLRDFLELDAGTAVACADDAPTDAIPEAGAKVKAPVMLIACRQDRVMPPENVAFTAETIPNCQVRWIEDCGHMPMLEKPDEYLTLLRSFLRIETIA